MTPSDTSPLQNFIIRALGFTYVMFGLFLTVALLTYNPFDPSLNRSSSGLPSNLAGQVGASLADCLVQFIGLSTILLIPCIAVWGSRMMFGTKISFFFIRHIALIIAVLTLSTVLAVIPDPFSLSHDMVGLGGVIGMLIVHRFEVLIGTFGVVSLALTLCLVLGFVAFGLSFAAWKKALQRVMRWAGIIGHGAKGVTGIKSTIAEALHRDDEEDDESVVDLESSGEIESLERRESIVETVRQPVASKKSRPQEKQMSLKLTKEDFTLPGLSLLTPADKKKKIQVSESALSQNARLLEKVLSDFGVLGKIVKVRPGPVVTLYELEPAAGTKSSRVIGLADDIARSMSAVSARIAVVPGRNAIGIELPNSQREMVVLREILESDEYGLETMALPLALGKNIGGDPTVVDLAKMPHLLVAGTTGSGKSVGINGMILSLLYRLPPHECKFIMIDPKMLELSVYDGIPHLLTPVVTEPGKAVVALKWAVKEMESRYRLMSQLGVRNIAGYNKRISEAKAKGEVLERTVQTGFDHQTGKPIFERVALEMNALPFIVVIVDEMADLMLVAGKDIESSIQRLAQMARAAGIHLIMATQRPSVDVITGVIKANFPTRISFQVTSRIDSRTILGEQGAEQLLGQGDMLYMAGGGRLLRCHGAFVDDREVEEVVSYLKAQGTPEYIEEVTEDPEDEFGGIDMMSGDKEADLYLQAVTIVCRDKKASTSYIQRCLKIGYNRAATLIEQMEREGVISAPNHVGRREVLIESLAELRRAG